VCVRYSVSLGVLHTKPTVSRLEHLEHQRTPASLIFLVCIAPFALSEPVGSVRTNNGSDSVFSQCI